MPTPSAARTRWARCRRPRLLLALKTANTQVSNGTAGLLQPIPWTFTMGAGNSQAGAGAGANGQNGAAGASTRTGFFGGVAAGAAVAGGLTAQQQQAHANQGLGNQIIGGANAQGAYVNNLWGSAGTNTVRPATTGGLFGSFAAAAGSHNNGNAAAAGSQSTAGAVTANSQASNQSNQGTGDMMSSLYNQAAAAGAALGSSASSAGQSTSNTIISGNHPQRSLAIISGNHPQGSSSSSSSSQANAAAERPTGAISIAELHAARSGAMVSEKRHRLKQQLDADMAGFDDEKTARRRKDADDDSPSRRAETNSRMAEMFRDKEVVKTQVLTVLSAHPCSTMSALLADQIRLDEIGLRAKSRTDMLDKRRDLLRDMAANIVSFRTLQFVKPNANEQVGGSSSSSSSSSAAAATPRGAEQSEVLFGPEVLVERLLYSQIPADAGVLNEYVVLASVLDEYLGAKAQGIAVLHTVKLILNMLEQDMSFIKFPQVTRKKFKGFQKFGVDGSRSGTPENLNDNNVVDMKIVGLNEQGEYGELGVVTEKDMKKMLFKDGRKGSELPDMKMGLGTPGSGNSGKGSTSDMATASEGLGRSAQDMVPMSVESLSLGDTASVMK